MRVVTDNSDDEGPRFSSTLSWSESPFTPTHAPRPALPASSSGQITKRRRPTVLFLNEGKAHEATQKRLESLAHVYYLVPREDEDGPAAIRRAVKTHGPFVATVYLPGFTNRVQWTMNRETLGPLSPSCKLFSAPGAGYDKVDVEWMTEVGAYYANNPIEVGRRTAQWALALILDSMRGVSAQFLSARAGNWVNRDVRSIDWLGATLGVIGMGNIGSQVAAAATGLGLRVIYSNRHKSEDTPYEYVSKEELYARSDVILLLTPLTEETRGMINKHSISQMKDGVIIVNVARGPVIVEQDLVDALQSGKVMRVALDVFEREPEIHTALKSNPNALITPHSAASTTNLLPEILNEMVSNVVKFLETGKPNTPVNEPKRV